MTIMMMMTMVVMMMMMTESFIQYCSVCVQNEEMIATLGRCKVKFSMIEDMMMMLMTMIMKNMIIKMIINVKHMINIKMM